MLKRAKELIEATYFEEEILEKASNLASVRKKLGCENLYLITYKAEEKLKGWRKNIFETLTRKDNAFKLFQLKAKSVLLLNVLNKFWKKVYIKN